ncbi:MAG: four helix bundle protein [Tissierellia bacterium]|nr:four helix bundle protein [Tissierellia bacterium]
MEENSFRKIIAWEKAHDLALDIYKLTLNFPKEETYGIVSQIRRAVSSIPANIAEGYGRKTTRQYINFLSIANGSLCEANYFLILAHDLGYIDAKDYYRLTEQCQEIGKILNSTIKTLKIKEQKIED